MLRWPSWKISLEIPDVFGTPSRRFFGLLFLCYLAFSCFAMRTGWIIPDGVGYASYPSSLVLDGDLNFWNQYVQSGIITQDLIHGATLTRSHYIFTFWTFGNSLLSLPFWLLGHALTYVSTLWNQHWTPNGFTIYYNIAIRFATAIFGLCEMVLCGFLLRKYATPRAVMAALVLALLGTPFYWYLFNFADGSHVPSSFAIALFLIVWSIYRASSRTAMTGFLLGILGAIVTMVKPNNGVIFLFPAAMWITEFKTIPMQTIGRQIFYVAMGGLIAFGLQFWIWQILFGNPMGPFLEKGVGHYYKFFEGRFWLVDVLFSSYHGLFFAAPVLLLSFYGLFRLIRTDAAISIASLLAIAAQIVLMASDRYFWEGASFGLRRVLDWNPVFALGIAYALEHSKHAFVKVAAAAACVWTMLLYLAYNAHPASALNEYQPPSQVVSWITDALIRLPAHLIPDLAAPPSILFPALLFLAPLGYWIYLGVIALGKQTQTPAAVDPPTLRHLMMVASVFVFAGCLLVFRATLNDTSAREKYPQEFAWLEAHQDSIVAYEQVQFLLQEGKYLALTRGWDVAIPSFQQALQMTPNHDQTMRQINTFVSARLPHQVATQYLKTLSP